MDPPADPPQSSTVAPVSATAAAAKPTPISAPPAANGADPVSAGSKRRPGRPPKLKLKPDAIQAPVPVFVPQPPQNADTGQGPSGPVNGRSRGRPRKNGQPTSGAGGGGSRRGRGRPKAAVAVRKISTGVRPRGRPPKPINVVAAPSSSAAANVGGAVAAVITGKRRGRPPRADGEAKKPRKISGKPLGRPRKNEAAAATRTPDSQLLVAYLDLKSKLEHLQSKVKQTVTSIGPSLDNEDAINTLHELELVAMNVNAPPPIVQSQPQTQS